MQKPGKKILSQRKGCIWGLRAPPKSFRIDHDTIYSKHFAGVEKAKGALLPMPNSPPTISHFQPQKLGGSIHHEFPGQKIIFPSLWVRKSRMEFCSFTIFKHGRKNHQSNTIIVNGWLRSVINGSSCEWERRMELHGTTNYYLIQYILLTVHQHAIVVLRYKFTIRHWLLFSPTIPAPWCS